ncbi:unnamed protein product, partial [Closterium sp. NIES-53]
CSYLPLSGALISCTRIPNKELRPTDTASLLPAVTTALPSEPPSELPSEPGTPPIPSAPLPRPLPPSSPSAPPSRSLPPRPPPPPSNARRRSSSAPSSANPLPNVRSAQIMNPSTAAAAASGDHRHVSTSTAGCHGTGHVALLDRVAFASWLPPAAAEIAVPRLGLPSRDVYSPYPRLLSRSRYSRRHFRRHFRCHPRHSPYCDSSPSHRRCFPPIPPRAFPKAPSAPATCCQCARKGRFIARQTPRRLR